MIILFKTVQCFPPRFRIKSEVFTMAFRILLLPGLLFPALFSQYQFSTSYLLQTY